MKKLTASIFLVSLFSIGHAQAGLLDVLGSLKPTTPEPTRHCSSSKSEEPCELK